MENKNNESKKWFIFNMINPYNYKQTNLFMLWAFFLWLVFDMVFVHIWKNSLWVWVFIFELLFFWIFFKAIFANKKKDFYAIFGITITLLISFWFAIFNNYTMSKFYMICLVFLNVFVLMYVSWISSKIRDKISSLFVYLKFYLITLQNLGQGVALWFQETKELKQHSWTIRTILLSLVVLWLMLLFIVPILTNADKIFENILNTYVFNYINFDLPDILTRIVVIFLVGAFTWTAMIVLNNLKPFESKEKEISFNIKDLASSIVLVGINIVYCLFVFVQIKYLFFGNHQMILDLWLNSYAEYIHKWFGELIIIWVFNFVVFAVIQHSLKSSNKSLFVKFMLTLLIVFTMVIIISAFKRIFMYVDSYGLTQERIFVFYIIFLIFAVMCFCIYKIFKKDASYLRYLFILFFGSFVVLWYINIDKTIAQYNIYHNIEIKKTYVDSSFNRSSWFRKSLTLDWDFIMSLSEDAIEEQEGLAVKDPNKLKTYQCKYDKKINIPFRHLNYFKTKVKDLWKCWK